MQMRQLAITSLIMLLIPLAALAVDKSCTPSDAQTACEEVTNLNDCIRRHAPRVNPSQDEGVFSKISTFLNFGYAGVHCGECGSFIKRCVQSQEDLRFYFPYNDNIDEESEPSE